MSLIKEEVHALVLGKIGFIVFDAPGSLITEESFKGISAILTQYEFNVSIEAVVFAGTHGRHFCGGVRLKWMQSLQNSPDMGEDVIDYFYEVALQIRAFPKPTIVAIEDGSCFGVGIEIAGLCDYVVAMKQNAQTIKFGALAIRYGFMLGLGVSWCLARKIGVAQTARFLVKKDTTSLSDAYGLGIVDVLLQGEDFTEEVCKFVHEVLEGVPPKKRPQFIIPQSARLDMNEIRRLSAGCSLLAVKSTLLALESIAASTSFEEALVFDNARFKRLFFSENAKRGIHGFLKRREPYFLGGKVG